jgi:hypothetical protein
MTENLRYPVKRRGSVLSGEVPPSLPKWRLNRRLRAHDRGGLTRPQTRCVYQLRSMGGADSMIIALNVLCNCMSLGMLFFIVPNEAQSRAMLNLRLLR